MAVDESQARPVASRHLGQPGQEFRRSEREFLLDEQWANQRKKGCDTVRS
ncbi:hypothetical protein [Herbaspirillum sp. ST 5-3]|nr:hypothetical protein [Herbaspirillum sp. ST 5-3]